LPQLPPASLLFSESNSRFLCEITPENVAAFEAQLSGVACACVGQTVAEPRLVIAIQSDGAAVVDESLDNLKAAWQRPLSW
jgi:phosphoribosylformylglycinamidine synthase